MAFQAGAIVSKISLDRTQFSASIKAVGKQTKTLGAWAKKNSAQFKKMGLVIMAMGTAALLTFKKMVKQYVELGDWIDKMAKRTGFSATALSELAYAADISGASLNDVEKSLKKMSMAIVDANAGLVTYTRYFDIIGIEVKELIGLKPEEQFIKIGAAIEKLTDETLKTAMAAQLFGRTGIALLPLFKEGEEGIRKLREEAHRLGIIFDEEAAAKAAILKDAQSDLKYSVQGLSFAIITDLIPVISSVTKEFTDWFVKSREGARDWTQAILGFFRIIGKGIQALMLAWHGLQVVIFKGAEFVVNAIKFQIDALLLPIKLLAKLPGYGILAKNMLKMVEKHTADLTTISEGYNEAAGEQIKRIEDIVSIFESFFTMLDKVKTKIKETKEETKELGSALIPLTRPLKMGPLLFDIPKMTAEDFKKWWKQWHKDLNEKWRKEWEDMMWTVRTIVGQISGILSQLSANQMQLIDNEEKRRTDALNSRNEKEKAALESWYEREREKIETTITNEEEKNEALAELAEAYAGKENDLAEKQAETQTKLEEDIAKKRRKAMRKQAIFQKAISLSMAIINISEAITKALTLGPFLGVAAATWIKVLGAIQIAAILAAPLPALQKGGRIGEAAIVGEAGPELFIPARPGEIIPLRGTAGMATAGPGPFHTTVHINIYPQRLDDRSINEVGRKIHAVLNRQLRRY